MFGSQGERWLTPAEAAVLLGLREPTLAIWRSQKKGPSYVRIGGRIKYEHDALVDWIKGRRVQHAA
jgi:Helix-turn-helix domain